jgi:RNA polymerase sigma-70 factor (ECF subfamily)
MTREEASRLVEPLFENWGPALVRYAARATGHLELAEDLVQEAFMALYSKVRGGAEIHNPKGWTLRVVRNQILKQKRTLSRRLEDCWNPGDLDSIPVADAPASFEREDVVGLFVVLTQREEEVILLRLESFKYREIAAELGISEKSVCTLLARALRKLQQASEQGVPRRISSRKHYGTTRTLQ